ncbi:four-helix bundle copper-binding protein [Pseudalkalibacillus decolorationis]|uniref:four-helix bundle copper-binding protein n=1 Tax=Pseudalkalibacillus decolorationis TaxID=163879 RepID=UPI002147E273
MREKYRECLDECLQCVVACDHCYDACLELNNSHMNNCIRLTRECAEICNFAASSMSKNSPFAERICVLCADVCEACADECNQHEHDHCKRCAEVCLKCAESCRKMLN